MRGARVVHEHLYVRDDFSAFHVGMAAHRPTVEAPVRGLYLAGDWVKLPYPAMLMEAACMAGLCAANAILRAAGLREEAIFAVPAKGLLAGSS
jgi:isorenieratene synthase